MKRILATTLLLATSAFAQNDADYTSQIQKFTTGPQFTTELVDHLPASATVPTPLKFLGYIAGAEGHLTYAEDVYRYMRALEAASPRVKVFSIGKSEEGREMILVAVSNEQTISSLDRYRDVTRKLSDPRNLSDADARQLIAAGKPMYYATGAMHSPETGSPEMLMELAYRLAVEDTPFIRNIRDNVIFLITPVLEVDGRDRQVDLWHYREKNPTLPTPPLVYWGHYVGHDNNRDNIGLALNLSRNVMKAYYDFHPQVIHDLHESVPFIYISTGTGPYNPSLDPLMIDEWHRMAYDEVNKLTERGLPGAWTHGFYDGWAPNYMFWIGMGHNTIGRFYETFGNRWPTTENRIHPRSEHSRMVPSESSVAAGEVVAARQHQLSRECVAVRAVRYGVESRALPRTVLDALETIDRESSERRAGRVCLSSRSEASGKPGQSPVAPLGPRNRDQRSRPAIHDRQDHVRERRVCRANGSTLQPPRRRDARRAVRAAGRPRV